jgi:hypothetical protein
MVRRHPLGMAAHLGLRVGLLAAVDRLGEGTEHLLDGLLVGVAQLHADDAAVDGEAASPNVLRLPRGLPDLGDQLGAALLEVEVQMAAQHFVRELHTGLRDRIVPQALHYQPTPLGCRGMNIQIIQYYIHKATTKRGWLDAQLALVYSEC